MTDLDTMMEMQRALQEKLYGYDIVDEDEDLRRQNLMWNIFALTDELHEAAKEFSWKNWASARYTNEDALKGELIDAFHFMMNLFLHAGMTAEDVYARYCAKHGVNVKRHEDGYDGVSNKCPSCHRDLKDSPPTERHVTLGLIPHVSVHCVCGQWLQTRTV